MVGEGENVVLVVLTRRQPGTSLSKGRWLEKNRREALQIHI
jgi:hypothetical protein